MKKNLKFIQDAIYNGKLVHKEGEIVELENDNGMADRWIKRAVAVEYVAPVAKPVPAVAPKEVRTAPALANKKDGKDNIAEKDL